jgi:hypothetical protein
VRGFAAEALTLSNPLQERLLHMRVGELDKQKRARALELFMAQRQFFIDKAFDKTDHKLRYLERAAAFSRLDALFLLLKLIGIYSTLR